MEKGHDKGQNNNKRMPLLLTILFGSIVIIAFTVFVINNQRVIIGKSIAQAAAGDQPPDVPPSEQPSGIYFFKPSFSLTVDYDLGEYKTLQHLVFGDGGLVANIETCEEKEQPLAECVMAEVKKINEEKLKPQERYGASLQLVNGPCNPEENIKSDLVEGYTACAASTDTDCVCQLTLQQAEQNQETPAITIDVPPKAESPSMAMNIDLFLNDVEAKTVAHLDTAPEIAEEPIHIALAAGEREKIIWFYKSAEGIAFIKDETRGDKKMCTINKRSFKFCARRSEKMYMVIPEGSKDSSLQPTVYKFALTFPERNQSSPVTG
ncbi:hypothetical protein HY488_01690 [Candidatus Woesearchaeota archaeon]|nr:hypothetical protein [Candidatus Woesearchaeota archaeon]